MSLQDREKELYGQKKPLEQTVRLNKKEKPQAQSVHNPWAQPASVATEATTSATLMERYGKIILIGLIVALLGAVSLAGYYLYQFFSTRDVALNASNPQEVLVGQRFTVALTFENIAKKTLAQPTISLVLPSGVVYLPDPQKRVVELGTEHIAPGETLKQEFEVMIVGETPKTYRFSGKASYNYESSANLSNRFEKGVAFDVLATDAVVSLDLTAPEKVLNGEEFEVTTRYHNTSKEALENARIVFEVPEVFSFDSSDPALEEMALVLPSLGVDEEGTVVFSGSVAGKEGGFFPIVANLKVNISGEEFTVRSKTANIGIDQSPFSLAIQRQGGTDIVRPGNTVGLTIEYRNNADINLSDVIMKVKLEGDILDFTNIRTDGYFNDRDHTITWTAANIAQFKELKAQESGSVSLVIPTLAYYPWGNATGKDFTISVEGEITSPTTPYNVAAKQTMGTGQLSIKVAGGMNFMQEVYFQEPMVSITNGGSLPPRVGEETQYTVHWTLSANGTDFNNTSVTAFLAPGVRWTGKVTSNTSVVPRYNDRTQEVVWDAGLVRGTNEDQAVVIFQIGYTPSSNQAGSKFQLVRTIRVSGTDAFTNTVTSLVPQPLESDDLKDSFLPDGFDKVQ